MKNHIFILLFIMLITGCKHEVIKERFTQYGKTKVLSKYVYSDKRDTLDYIRLDYYPSGELLSKFIFKEGKKNGEFVQFKRKGSLLEKGNFLNDKLDGIFQKYDSVGNVAKESYFINGIEIIYSDFYLSKSCVYRKQIFHPVINDTLYPPIGTIVRKGNIVIKDLSSYALIESADTVGGFDYCLILKVFSKQNPIKNYEIAFGTPNEKFNFRNDFEKIDTSFVTTKNEIQICDFKNLAPGLNHLFCRIIVNYDPCNVSIFYAYKDIFVQKN
jgi:hypothetical protein